jgi:hypothetical protein
MSAFMCSDSHITALAAYASKRENQLYMPSFIKDASLKDIGKILHDENLKSVNHRYEESEVYSFEACKWARNQAFSPVQIIKAAKSLAYQSGESPTYKSSDASAIIDAIITLAITQLPGYNKAEWEINKPS